MHIDRKRTKAGKRMICAEPMQQMPWTIIHSPAEWRAHVEGSTWGATDSCRHVPGSPKSFPCLVETLLIDAVFHHRFVYLEDAYRLLFGSGVHHFDFA
jgi:hypothetical protein